MDTDGLVGSWTMESGDSNLDLKADGTYIRVSSFQMPITFETLAIDDEGTYSVTDATITFTPMTGHYRRNGVDEGFDSTVRQSTFRFEPKPDQTGTNLVIDDGAYIREQG